MKKNIIRSTAWLLALLLTLSIALVGCDLDFDDIFANDNDKGANSIVGSDNSAKPSNKETQNTQNNTDVGEQRAAEADLISVDRGK